jgi:hypothetical protein
LTLHNLCGLNSQQRGLETKLQLMDVQSLAFPDGSFDSVAATCVFCSVPDPILGLAVSIIA